MDLLGPYRRAKISIAVPIAALISVALAIGLAVAGIHASGFLLREFGGPVGPGAGVLVILVAMNIAVSAFIALFAALVNLHRTTTWRTPTFAFVLCICLVRLMGPFNIQFAPFMLGTGAIAWAVCCWLMHRRSATASNVLQT